MKIYTYKDVLDTAVKWDEIASVPPKWRGTAVDILKLPKLKPTTKIKLMRWLDVFTLHGKKAFIERFGKFTCTTIDGELFWALNWHCDIGAKTQVDWLLARNDRSVV
mgnify:CR=1 FL=1